MVEHTKITAMEKCTSLLENKFILIGLIVLSVLTVYQLGKVVGELAFYLVN